MPLPQEALRRLQAARKEASAGRVAAELSARLAEAESETTTALSKAERENGGVYLQVSSCNHLRAPHTWITVRMPRQCALVKQWLLQTLRPLATLAPLASACMPVVARSDHLRQRGSLRFLTSLPRNWRLATGCLPPTMPWGWCGAATLKSTAPSLLPRYTLSSCTAMRRGYRPWVMRSVQTPQRRCFSP